MLSRRQAAQHFLIDGSHADAPSARLVLRLDRQRDGLVVGELCPLPEALDEIEAEIPAEGLLDHLAVAPARSCCAHLHGSKDFLVDRERRPHFRHHGILAS